MSPNNTIIINKGRHNEEYVFHLFRDIFWVQNPPSIASLNALKKNSIPTQKLNQKNSLNMKPKIKTLWSQKRNGPRQTQRIIKLFI